MFASGDTSSQRLPVLNAHVFWDLNPREEYVPQRRVEDAYTVAMIFVSQPFEVWTTKLASYGLDPRLRTRLGGESPRL